MKARVVIPVNAVKRTGNGTGVLKRNLKANMATITSTAAHHFMSHGFVPAYLYDYARSFGVLPGSFKTRILNRVDLWNSTIIERTLDKSKSLKYHDTVKELREILDTKYFFPEQE